MNLKRTLQTLIPLIIAGVLLAVTFRGVNLAELWNDISKADLAWVLASLLMLTLSHFIRAWRWLLVLRPAGYRLDLFSSFAAVFGGYFVNIIFPRAGEVSRCGMVNRSHKVPVEDRKSVV